MFIVEEMKRKSFELKTKETDTWKLTWIEQSRKLFGGTTYERSNFYNISIISKISYTNETM